MVKVGDSIPSVELVEGNPGNKVNLATELASGPGLIIGVPAAFSELLSFFRLSPTRHLSIEPFPLSISIQSSLKRKNSADKAGRPNMLRLPRSRLHRSPQAQVRRQGLCRLRQ